MRGIFVATSNPHKADEIRAILGSEFLVLTLRDTNARLEIEETGATFQENALLKALHWAAYLAADECHMSAEWALADDSGLQVDALGGAPGIHSARFAALDLGTTGNSPDGDNNQKLLRLLANIPPGERSARFICSLTLVPVLRGESVEAMARSARFFEGACEGQIGEVPQGNAGFGYDPLFFPAGFNRSFAELSSEEKNRISHRSKALAQLKAHFQGH
jgi:XTP/dITP diphosphohydrolase